MTGNNVIACYKWVVDEADIIVSADGSVDVGRGARKISDYDCNTIAAAVRLADRLGVEAVAMTCGSNGAKASLKPALARGPASAILVDMGAVGTDDGAATARALAAAIARTADAGVVLCSEGASDTFARQMASRLGALLDWPVVTSVSALEPAGTGLRVTRRLEDHLEIVDVGFPVVLAVLPELCDAPIPGMAAVLSAGRKPIATYTPADLGVDTAAIPASHRGYISSRKNTVFADGTPAERVARFAAALRKEGVWP
jgi:electron transfer flavoprotein beta subunit